MVPLKWTVVLIAVGTLMMPVVSQVPSTCSWLTPSDTSGCVKEATCQSGGDVIYIWEDCPKGGELFTITNSTVSLESDCSYASGNPVVTLTKQLDAEDSSVHICNTIIDGVATQSKLFFSVDNINEFPPYPAKDTVPTTEVYVDENKKYDVAKKIYYSDDDLGETEGLSCIQISPDYENIFSLTPEKGVDETNNIKTFKFSVKKELDFEKQVFYKVEYNITSMDEKKNTRSAKQTFFVYVNDKPDNPPFWSQIVPVFPLEECDEEETLFTVTAQDRDVDVGYDIKYTMVEDPEGDYFKIDETTGVVSRNASIDREELIENGISSFSLTINATEYKKDGTEGEKPNSNEQVTIITILDCNDEEPTFNSDSYEITMDELYEAPGKDLDLKIVVTDMDEGTSGSFTLITSDPRRLGITPQGKQSLDVTLTALYEDNGNNYFNYEVHGDTPLNFTITATEDADPSHTNTASVTIILRDVNDNAPEFSSHPYKKTVSESTPRGKTLLKVEANDQDQNKDFGKLSIRYSLDTSCHELQIDNTTGKVTLATDLNYDDTNTDNEIHCSVTARDRLGTDLTDNSEIIITVTDVVDETPWFKDSDIPMTIKENSAHGDEVDSFIVNDADKGAYINFTIVSSHCSGSASTPKDVDGWFTVVPGTPNYPEHNGIVKVTGDIDREACSEVTLIIMAVDWETEENADNDNGTVIITIDDVKDEPPIFKGDYKDLYIDEFDENNPPKESVPVFQVTVSDPDEGDTINLSISKGGEKLELSKTQVTVEAGEEAKVDVRTKKNEIIDREAQATIEVEITLTNPKKEPSTIKNFHININDLNDKVPKIKADLCNKFIHVLEDDGTASTNGTAVYSISATDDDVDKPYNTVSYMMINDQLPESKNQQTPFTVNEITGEVTVFLDEDKKTLNREQYDEWELFFRAYDHCNISDLKCKVLSSDQCKVTVIVDDVNDNDPRNLTWQPHNDIITVTDFIRKDEDLGYLLWALDDDRGENASLTYRVVSTFLPPSDEEMDLFYAVNENVTDVTSCRLYAKQDFQGMNFTGTYRVTLEARDGGNRATNFSITIEITDANDQAPYFVFDGCPGEADVTTIRMMENAYTPGEGRPNPMQVKCSGPDGSPFNIHVKDNDKDAINREVVVEIDKVNSTVENADNEEELLNYWSLDSKDCTNGCHLQLSHKIDREKGTAYNLALHVRNKVEDPLVQETWAKVRVVVTNAYEYDPYFCPEGNCTQIAYMYENNPEASTEFMEATDLDNTHASPDDDQYQKVFYFIVGGDRNYFQTISDNQRKIILRNMPDGLDREMRQNYSLEIYATNDAGGGNVEIDNVSRNDTLHFTIYVGDVNDEKPLFPDDVIFSSFTQSNKNGDRLTTIEAHDADLNETLTYTILDDLQWFETEVVPDTSFTLERKDDLSVYLKLDFDPRGMTKGYCNFTIRVKDAGDHTDEAEVKIYIINEDYQVAMYFSNNVEDVKKMQREIEYAYSEAYSVNNEYTCVIDSITPTQSSTGETLSSETTVYMHFIDYEKNEPVDKKIILDLSDSASVRKDLQQRLDLIDINLDSVDTYLPPTNEKRPEDTILLMKILLAVVSLVLGSLLVLLITIYCIRTRSLTRKVKVLSTNTFGSKEDGLNHMGFDVVPVPGSNLAQVHGNHNPVFSENGAFELKNQDTGSISSGDSVLVGVEDNPEFKNYSAKGETHTSSSQGFENPSFGRSIDEVSAPPPGVQGGMKGNPLLNLGSLQEDNEPSTTAMEHHTFGGSEGSEVDAASLNQINSNFSFS